MRIHRIVMEAFCGKSNLDVNHIDACRSNNCLRNLEYVTKSQNSIHAFKLGLSKGNIGSRNGMAKLKECEVEELRRISKHFGARLTSKMFKISYSRARSIIRNSGWNHVKEKSAINV